MAQSSCKRDTKSKSHPGTKLAPVRVFSCKYPLRKAITTVRGTNDPKLPAAPVVNIG